MKPCTYSQGMVVDYLPTSSLENAQLSLLSGIDMPAKSSENEQQKDGSQDCKCGKGTLGCSIHPSTRDEWIASMQDSLARILALPENRQGLEKKHAVASTVKSSASLAWFDQNSCSWKTSQQSFLTDSEPSSMTWPRSGMTRNGFAYALPIVGRITTGIDGGFWRTPTAHEWKNTGHATQVYLSDQVRPEQVKNKKKLGSMNYWPTPNTMDSLPPRENIAEINRTRGGRKNRVALSNLREAVHSPVYQKIWPTPTTMTGGEKPAPSHFNGKHGWNLGAAVQMFPTPNASDCRDRGNMSQPSIQRRAEIGKQLNLSMVVHPTSGQLNPFWVEWLMGFPIGFTVSKDWVTPKSRYKQQLPTNSLEEPDAIRS